MPLADRTAIPLDAAWYCESCRAVTNSDTCCLCASAEHTHRLALWLNRLNVEPPVIVHAGGVVITISHNPVIAQNEH